MIRQFPITTTDQWANESILGLCSPLCADISLTNPSSGMVVSEYGVRQGINTYIEGHLNPVNLGVGEGVFTQVDGNVIELKRLTTNNPNRVKIGMDYTHGEINIRYDGRPEDAAVVESHYVQGGNQTLEFNVNEFNSGVSTTSVEISANMVDEINAYTDVAIGKIGIHIPSGNAFPNAGEKIYIGTTANHEQFGYFLTKTAQQIEEDGEWMPLIYSSGMYEDQFEYFTTNTDIYAFTNEATMGSNTNFDVKLWYDNVNYNSINDEQISIDSAVNNQTNMITRSIVGDGFIEVRWFDGEYTDEFNNILTNFNIMNSSDNQELYGDKDNRIKIPVSDGDIVSIYIRTVDTNTGTIIVNYSKETF